MNHYVGSRCPVCDKKFTEGADIVVCPVCGAPHHRDCYAISGHCALEEHHSEGASWDDTPPEGVKVPPPGSAAYAGRHKPHYPNMGSPQQQEKAKGVVFCSACNTENPDTNLFCNLCGQWLGAGQTEPTGPPGRDGQKPSPIAAYLPPQMDQQMQFNPKYALYGGLSPEEKIGTYTARDYAVYVGKSSSYYIPRFKAVADSGTAVSLNMSAWVLHFFYFFYRKMYAMGAILLAMFLISSIPTVQYLKEMQQYNRFVNEVGIAEDGTPLQAYDKEAEALLEHYQKASSISNFIFFLIRTLASVVATRLYYDHATKKMDKALENVDMEDLREGRCLACESTLEKAGGVNWVIPIVLFIAMYLSLGIFLIIQRFL